MEARGCVVSRPPKKALAAPARLNFLLGASDADLDNFELARLAEIADLRCELTAIVDRMVEQLSQAALARWFKEQDRQSLKHAIDNEESAEEWAKRMIRDGQRNKEELVAGPMPSPWIIRPSLPPAGSRSLPSGEARPVWHRSIR